MTLAAMARLRERGVIEVPWPASRWEFAPDSRVAPIEQFQWRLVWQPYETNMRVLRMRWRTTSRGGRCCRVH